MRAGGDPFQISSTSKLVKVKISPASQRVSFATHRARTIARAARDSFVMDMRISVVAWARPAPEKNNAAKKQIAAKVRRCIITSPPEFRWQRCDHCLAW